jgi:hypothetical protein
MLLFNTHRRTTDKLPTINGIEFFFARFLHKTNLLHNKNYMAYRKSSKQTLCFMSSLGFIFDTLI